MSSRLHSSIADMCPALGHGLGLRLPQCGHVLETQPPVDWFEAVAESFFNVPGARPVEALEAVRRAYPIVLHGVSLSIGSVEPLDKVYLSRLRELHRRIEPAWVSDHLCWTGVGGENRHDLLPLPYTEEALAHVVLKLEEAQDFLGRRILLENVSSHLTFDQADMSEWEFLVEVSRRADCGILLDVNAIYISSRNHGFDPLRYLDAIPPDRVGQLQLAGHRDAGERLIDAHDRSVSEPVWSLYAQALERFGNVSASVAWDARFPEFGAVAGDLDRARRIAADILCDVPGGPRTGTAGDGLRRAAGRDAYDHR